MLQPGFFGRTPMRQVRKNKNVDGDERISYNRNTKIPWYRLSFNAECRNSLAPATCKKRIYQLDLKRKTPFTGFAGLPILAGPPPPGGATGHVDRSRGAIRVFLEQCHQVALRWCWRLSDKRQTRLPCRLLASGLVPLAGTQLTCCRLLAPRLAPLAGTQLVTNACDWPRNPTDAALGCDWMCVYAWKWVQLADAPIVGEIFRPLLPKELAGVCSMSPVIQKLRVHVFLALLITGLSFSILLYHSPSWGT